MTQNPSSRNAARMIRSQLSEARDYLRTLEANPKTDDAEIARQSGYIQGLEDALDMVQQDEARHAA